MLYTLVRTLNVPCAALIPSGPAYPGIAIANQVCAVLGATPGSNLVSGPDYIGQTFGYSYANVWRNLGIIIGYLIFFLAGNLYTTEYQPDESSTGGVMIFKRGKETKNLEPVTSADGDSEKGNVVASTKEIPGDLKNKTTKVELEAFSRLAAGADIFSWRNVNYDVKIKGNDRRLLNDVSGFVVPGKMTACE